MLSTYIVQAGPAEAGLLVLHGSVFRFHASTSAFAILDQRDFDTVGQAEAAARDLMVRCAGPACTRASRVKVMTTS